MEHIMQLKGKGKAELTLMGITEAGDTLYAMGYFLVDPKRKGELVPNVPAFLRIMRPKPYRRGCVFRAETGVKYRNVEPLELNKVHLYAITLENEIKLERVK